MVNLPVFVTHNEASSDFTIQRNSDSNLIGEYAVTVRSEIQVPSDYTETSFTTVSGTFEFVIKVESCIVSSYTASQVINIF